MLCSTIIPTINRPSLERAVRSALDQELGLEQHEILVFNNSSGPLPEVAWLKAPQNTIVNTHSNLHDASNKGAAMASGKYINFLHNDDYLLPGALKALADAAESTGCCWVCGAYKLVDDKGNLISVDRP
jgi:glycosyltransferase involved in cell wall biosynthesis